MTLPVNLTVSQAFLALFTFVSPNLLAFITHPDWSAFKKGSTYVLYSILVSICYLLYSGGLNFQDLTGTASAVFILAVTAYTGAWKPLADAIEAKKSGVANTSIKALGANKRGSSVFDNMYTK